MRGFLRDVVTDAVQLEGGHFPRGDAAECRVGEPTASGTDGCYGHLQRLVPREGAQLFSFGEHAAVQARGAGEPAGPAVGAAELGDVFGADSRGAVERVQVLP